MTANVHSYPFFLATAVALGWACVSGLNYAPGRKWSAYLISSLMLCAIVGPLLARSAGQIAVFGLVALAWAPGWFWLAKQWLGPSLLALVAFAGAASLQVSRTVHGILSGDTFLEYRQASSVNLGVPVVTALLPVLLVIGFCLRTLHRKEDEPMRWLLLGGSTSVAFMILNDRWGFDQEPYRFLIDSIALAALVVGPVAARSIARLLDVKETTRPGARGLAAAALCVFMMSLADFVGFRATAAGAGGIDVFSGKYQAVAELVDDSAHLIAIGPCLDARLAKLATSGRVATYNKGIAWPDERDAIDNVMQDAASGKLRPFTLDAADVGIVALDSSCPVQWNMLAEPGFTLVGTQAYDPAGAAISLWARTDNG